MYSHNQPARLQPPGKQRRKSKDFSSSKSLTSMEYADKIHGHSRSVNELPTVASRKGRRQNEAVQNQIQHGL
jgi:hypothetical protein